MATTHQESVPLPDSAERQPVILVVEDEVLIRLLITDYLRECGFKVYEAGSAPEAMEILNPPTVQIDLVFSDVRMPGEMDGFGLSQWVKTHRPAIPIILTSGNAKKVELTKGLCENEPFFEKPYDVGSVVTRIRGLISGRK